MEMRLEEKGWARIQAFVLFSLEMKLSPANLAFSKSRMLFFFLFLSLSLCFFLSFWKRSIQVLIRTLLWKNLSTIWCDTFLAGDVIESWAIWAMIYEQLLEDDKPTMWKRRVLGVIKTLRTHKGACLPVCFCLSLDNSTGVGNMAVCAAHGTQDAACLLLPLCRHRVCELESAILFLISQSHVRISGLAMFLLYRITHALL